MYAGFAHATVGVLLSHAVNWGVIAAALGRAVDSECHAYCARLQVFVRVHVARAGQTDQIIAEFLLGVGRA